MNKKGFTLIELLAVIVILAIIALIITTNILKTLSASRKSTFNLYGTRIISKTAEKMYEKYINNEVKETEKINIKNLGFRDTGNFRGCIVYSDEDNKPTFVLYLTDGRYSYNGVNYKDVETDDGFTRISEKDEDVNAVTAYCGDN